MPLYVELLQPWAAGPTLSCPTMRWLWLMSPAQLGCTKSPWECESLWPPPAQPRLDLHWLTSWSIWLTHNDLAAGWTHNKLTSHHTCTHNLKRSLWASAQGVQHGGGHLAEGHSVLPPCLSIQLWHALNASAHLTTKGVWGGAPQSSGGSQVHRYKSPKAPQDSQHTP
jgi:hypothetical protein